MRLLDFYRTGEFARRIGVTPVTLREWERRGILLPHHRSPTGYRYYSANQVDDYFAGKLLGKVEEGEVM